MGGAENSVVGDDASHSGAKAEAQGVVKDLLKNLMNGASASPSNDNTETIDGIPVGHKKCYMRACLHKEGDGQCGAAVVTCSSGTHDVAMKDRTKLSKTDAAKLVKKDMQIVSPFAGKGSL